MLSCKTQSVAVLTILARFSVLKSPDRHILFWPKCSIPSRLKLTLTKVCRFEVMNNSVAYSRCTRKNYVLRNTNGVLGSSSIEELDQSEMLPHKAIKGYRYHIHRTRGIEHSSMHATVLRVIT